jgi:hypothetical protein
MVKNVNNLCFTEKIRFGRYTNETQPNNSIVLNASKKEIPQMEECGFFVSPIRNTIASNVLMYDSTTKEIVDSGVLNLQKITELGSVTNVHTKFKSLEVENLDVIHLNKINVTEIDNPIFELGKNNTENPRDVFFTMTKGSDQVILKYDGTLSISGNDNLKFHIESDATITGNLMIDKKLETSVIESNTIKSNDLEVYGKLNADGSLLKNITYDQIGDTFEKCIHFKQGFQTPWLSGNGSRITDLSLDQLNLTTKKPLSIGVLHIDGITTMMGKVKIYNSLKVTESIIVNKDVYAKTYYGDGTKLDGVAHESIVSQNKEKITILQKNVDENKEKITILQKNVDENKEKLNIIETKFNENKNIRLDTIEDDLIHLKHKTELITSNSKHIDYIIPNISFLLKESEKFTLLDSKINTINDKISCIKNIKENIHDLLQLKNTPSKIDTLEKDIHTLKETNSKIFENEKEIINNKTIVNNIFSEIQTLVVTQEKNIKNIENELPRIARVENEIQRIDLLETFVPRINVTYSNVYDIQKSLPPIVERIITLETTPLRGDGCLVSNISLQHVMTYGNETDKSMTVGGGIKTTHLLIDNKPNLTSRIGEVKCININDIAEINGFNKANNGTTSGQPGGLVFKTKRPSGKIENSMLIDGNGKVVIGSHQTHPSALLSLDSKSSGLLLPRMTWIEMKNIQNPEPGLMIYEVESDTLFIYKRSGWTSIS